MILADPGQRQGLTGPRSGVPPIDTLGRIRDSGA